MLQTVRITSKRQITIPVAIFNELGLCQGDRLVVQNVADTLVIQKSQQILDELAGSLSLPKKYKNKSLDFIIREAKNEYFTSKK